MTRMSSAAEFQDATETGLPETAIPSEQLILKLWMTETRQFSQNMCLDGSEAVESSE